MIKALEALNRLETGNSRFLSEPRKHRPRDEQRFAEMAESQEPFAIILGCSDSRVPAEIVFDQGLGDLFVIRVAGNIVAPSQIGSVEFAAEQFGTRLVVVMGHSRCGAVKATIDELHRPSKDRSPNLASIVDRIRPVVEPLLDFEDSTNPDRLLDMAVRANIRASANQLRHGSKILENLIENEGLLVVGAEYCLNTGKVEFFDGMPNQQESEEMTINIANFGEIYLPARRRIG